MKREDPFRNFILLMFLRLRLLALFFLLLSLRRMNLWVGGGCGSLVETFLVSFFSLFKVIDVYLIIGCLHYFIFFLNFHLLFIYFFFLLEARSIENSKN